VAAEEAPNDASLAALRGTQVVRGGMAAGTP